jgi:hypothetical protein
MKIRHTVVADARAQTDGRSFHGRRFFILLIARKTYTMRLCCKGVCYLIGIFVDYFVISVDVHLSR